jgi:hypothetical protein
MHESRDTVKRIEQEMRMKLRLQGGETRGGQLLFESDRAHFTVARVDVVASRHHHTADRDHSENVADESDAQLGLKDVVRAEDPIAQWYRYEGASDARGDAHREIDRYVAK